MRVLIGFYLAVGLVYMLMSSAISYMAVRSLLDTAADGRWQGDRVEGFLIAAICFVVGLLPLLTAWGLWKRWRLVRLALLAISWFILAECAVAIPVGLAMLAGLIDGGKLGIDDSPGVACAIVAAVSTFAVVHLWVLLPRPARETSRGNAEPLYGTLNYDKKDH
jgi:hypothetical protein